MTPGRTLIFNIFILLVSLSTILAESVHIYVSPSGLDTNNGLSATDPLKSLQKATDKLDDTGIKGKDVYIELMSGYHDLSSTLIFKHGYTAPVTIRSYQHQQVHVTGGKRIQSNLFTKVTDVNILKRIPHEAHDKVRQIHLPDAGITDYGKLSSYGFYVHRTAPLEVFINSQPLHLAEWPNKNFINVDEVPDGRSGKRFTYENSSRDSRWVGEKEPWVYGYWYYSWADDSVPVATINSSIHQITLATKNRYGLKKGSLRYDGKVNGYSNQGGYFRVINMLSELDQPGEYYVDRSTGILYLWPNTATGTLQQTDIVYVSLLHDCIQLASGVNNINLEDFTLEACRRYGIAGISSSHVKITNLEIRNTGSYGVNCDKDCRSITVSRCDIHDTDGGVSLTGGNRVKLESSGNVIEDNHIWKFGRATQVGANGISPQGVNILMRYNHLHDGPYTCIRWAGNDHIMEYNHFSRCCHDSSDCGAIHAGRDWTMRGNVIRYNHVHDTIRYWPGASVRGVMLDDQYSSVNIEYNVFYHNEIHTNIGGGRDNIVRYNVFYDATSSSMQVDGRGIGKNSHPGSLATDLVKMPINNTLWSSRYPKLAAMAHSSRKGYPEGNQIYHNVYYNEHGKKFIAYSGGMENDAYYHTYENKHSFSSSDFLSPANNDFRLQCTAKQWANGVNFPQPITLDKVGPRYPYGPTYLNKGVKPTITTTSYTPGPCNTGTVAPETNIPRGSYLPDGTSPNTLITNITNVGCWLLVNSCPADSKIHGTFRDTYGEQHEQAATDEAKCLARAAEMWRHCGSAKNKPVTVVYGPTGAMTFGGDGCFFADYGCKNDNRPRFERDYYAEQHENGSTSEASCLRRAAPQWKFCGSQRDKPYTSIFRPTGAISTGGAGCWIKVTKCPADKTVKYYFYDSLGSSNLDTDNDVDECHNRAGYFWRKCGSHSQYPVTAFYRPSASHVTVPKTNK
ncbi:hypothetical protein SNE40_001817 [Patella caerulea]|uniref:Right handed beta helix domain-containing protein n=1 Tax=Patella caerulea TaxID=87958 RepID=A0AAN8Q232_PATCE